jgi:hypothetical protein
MKKQTTNKVVPNAEHMVKVLFVDNFRLDVGRFFQYSITPILHYQFQSTEEPFLSHPRKAGSSTGASQIPLCGRGPDFLNPIKGKVLSILKNQTGVAIRMDGGLPQRAFGRAPTTGGIKWGWGRR